MTNMSRRRRCTLHPALHLCCLHLQIQIKSSKHCCYRAHGVYNNWPKTEVFLCLPIRRTGEKHHCTIMGDESVSSCFITKAAESVKNSQIGKWKGSDLETVQLLWRLYQRHLLLQLDFKAKSRRKRISVFCKASRRLAPTVNLCFIM